ncbi:hypothetical protein Theos_1696 [Thermus oshimai JL-2]|uniref:Uncharacterized protein n=1 Tax=Thermus oshimai JL-2 TaxID=751945 RepID=K7R717_THEOS|nr:hypothetical protein [Thermus oshimai]AFV76719.1 hypothetical protein Theos_1696 [Thermus oshimai JL-2]
MPYLRFTTGDRLRLDGEEMPGVVTAVEVEGENSIEKLTRDGEPGDVTVLRGYRDFRIRITIRLAGPNPLQEVKKLHAKFAKSKTEPLRVVHPHLAARGIEKALFARLVTSEEGGQEGLEAILELTQVEPREALKAQNKAEKEKLEEAVKKGPVAGPPPGSAQAKRNEAVKKPPEPPDFIKIIIEGGEAGLKDGKALPDALIKRIYELLGREQK